MRQVLYAETALSWAVVEAPAGSHLRRHENSEGLRRGRFAPARWASVEHRSGVTSERNEQRRGPPASNVAGDLRVAPWSPCGVRQATADRNEASGDGSAAALGLGRRYRLQRTEIGRRAGG